MSNFNSNRLIDAVFQSHSLLDHTDHQLEDAARHLNRYKLDPDIRLILRRILRLEVLKK